MNRQPFEIVPRILTHMYSSVPGRAQPVCVAIEVGTGIALDAADPRLIDQLNIAIGESVELVVVSVKKRGIRCLHLPTRLPVTFRKVRWEMEGETITVAPTKVWQFKNTVYIAGTVTDKRIDIHALNIKPLKLENEPDDEEKYKQRFAHFSHFYQTIKRS